MTSDVQAQPDTFSEPWHAEVMALAETLVRDQVVSASEWASALGGELAASKERGEEDCEVRYYVCALRALQKLTEHKGLIGADECSSEIEAWTKAYQTTPHGKPVKLAERE